MQLNLFMKLYFGTLYHHNLHFLLYEFLIKNFNRLKDKELDKNTVNYNLDLL